MRSTEAFPDAYGHSSGRKLLAGLYFRVGEYAARRNQMKVVIQVAERDDARAWALLQRHSAGVALPNRTFVVSEDAAAALRQAEVGFAVLSIDTDRATEKGVALGERI